MPNPESGFLTLDVSTSTGIIRPFPCGSRDGSECKWLLFYDVCNTGGTGELDLQIANAVGETGFVLATDASADMASSSFLLILCTPLLGLAVSLMLLLEC